MVNRNEAVEMAIFEQKRLQACREESDQVLRDGRCKLLVGMLIRGGELPEPIVKLIPDPGSLVVVQTPETAAAAELRLAKTKEKYDTVMFKHGCKLDVGLMLWSGNPPQPVAKIVIDEKCLIPPGSPLGNQ